MINATSLVIVIIRPVPLNLGLSSSTPWSSILTSQGIPAQSPTIFPIFFDLIITLRKDRYGLFTNTTPTKLTALHKTCVITKV